LLALAALAVSLAVEAVEPAMVMVATVTLLVLHCSSEGATAEAEKVMSAHYLR
jgi:hypothetical protein